MMMKSSDDRSRRQSSTVRLQRATVLGGVPSPNSSVQHQPTVVFGIKCFPLWFLAGLVSMCLLLYSLFFLYLAPQSTTALLFTTTSSSIFVNETTTTKEGKPQHQHATSRHHFPLVVELGDADHNARRQNASSSLFLFVLTTTPNLVPLSSTRNANSTKPDYGGLNFAKEHLSDDIDDDEARIQQEKEAQIEAMDVIDVRAIRFGRTRPAKGCVQPQWTRQQYPNCHAFHELASFFFEQRQSSSWEYLGSGHFRDAFLLEQQQNPNRTISVVLKSNRLAYYMDYTQDNIDRVRREALMMQELHSVPRINTVFGYCGSSILVQPANATLADTILPFYPDYQTKPGRITEQNLTQWQNDFDGGSLNTLRDHEKLDIALQMAESLADIVGFHKSPVVHDDIKLDQWLMLPAQLDGGDEITRRAIVLNDFNCAFFLQYNPDTGEYCRQYRSLGGTVFRAPEELDGDYVDDKMDVWPFGDILHILLTGKCVAAEEFSSRLE